MVGWAKNTRLVSCRAVFSPDARQVNKNLPEIFIFRARMPGYCWIFSSAFAFSCTVRTVLDTNSVAINVGALNIYIRSPEPKSVLVLITVGLCSERTGYHEALAKKNRALRRRETRDTIRHLPHSICSSVGRSSTTVR